MRSENVCFFILFSFFSNTWIRNKNGKRRNEITGDDYACTPDENDTMRLAWCAEKHIARECSGIITYSRPNARNAPKCPTSIKNVLLSMLNVCNIRAKVYNHILIIIIIQIILYVFIDGQASNNLLLHAACANNLFGRFCRVAGAPQ